MRPPTPCTWPRSRCRTPHLPSPCRRRPMTSGSSATRTTPRPTPTRRSGATSPTGRSPGPAARLRRAFRGGAWTVSIDKDSTGRLWVVLPRPKVLYSYSDDNGPPGHPQRRCLRRPATRSTSARCRTRLGLGHRPFGAGSKDTVGVMWSDQDNLPAAGDNGYYFLGHRGRCRSGRRGQLVHRQAAGPGRDRPSIPTTTST